MKKQVRIQQYRTISVPKDLMETVKKTLEEHPELGYSSVTEFIKDAIRQAFIDLKREGKLAPMHP